MRKLNDVRMVVRDVAKVAAVSILPFAIFALLAGADAPTWLWAMAIAAWAFYLAVAYVPRTLIKPMQSLMDRLLKIAQERHATGSDGQSGAQSRAELVFSLVVWTAIFLAVLLFLYFSGAGSGWYLPLVALWLFPMAVTRVYAQARFNARNAHDEGTSN